MNSLTTNTLIIALYFLAIMAFSFLKRKSLPGKVTYLFRALLPSWRFFEDFDEAPTLYYRHSLHKSQELGSWSKCLVRPKRHFYNALYNPEANYILAAGSVVQHLMSDVNDLPELSSSAVESLVSYQLAKNLVKFHLSSEAFRYQFKISGITDDLLLSPIYDVQEESR